MSEEPRHLSITRTFAAPRAAVWRCWTDMDLLKQWFCPKPWFVSRAEWDLRPGGATLTVMNGPNGEEMANPGQLLEIVEGERLVFTDAFVGDWVPGAEAPFMVGHVDLSDTPEGGTRMVWGARHWTDEATEQHRSMGFEAGWNAAADQLDALASSL
jgi:uncharacterized protein YndB with AHSA1/START domain